MFIPLLWWISLASCKLRSLLSLLRCCYKHILHRCSLPLILRGSSLATSIMRAVLTFQRMDHAVMEYQSVGLDLYPLCLCLFFLLVVSFACAVALNLLILSLSLSQLVALKLFLLFRCDSCTRSANRWSIPVSQVPVTIRPFVGILFISNHLLPIALAARTYSILWIFLSSHTHFLGLHPPLIKILRVHLIIWRCNRSPCKMWVLGYLSGECPFGVSLVGCGLSNSVIYWFGNYISRFFGDKLSLQIFHFVRDIEQWLFL